eukprot:98458_1
MLEKIAHQVSVYMTITIQLVVRLIHNQCKMRCVSWGKWKRDLVLLPNEIYKVPLLLQLLLLLSAVAPHGSAEKLISRKNAHWAEIAISFSRLFYYLFLFYYFE